MTSRPASRQTTEQEARWFAAEYVKYRAMKQAHEPESASWDHWCGSLALGAYDRLAIRARVRRISLVGKR